MKNVRTGVCPEEALTAKSSAENPDELYIHHHARPTGPWFRLFHVGQCVASGTDKDTCVAAYLNAPAICHALESLPQS